MQLLLVLLYGSSASQNLATDWNRDQLRRSSEIHSRLCLCVSSLIKLFVEVDESDEDGDLSLKSLNAPVVDLALCCSIAWVGLNTSDLA